MAFFLPGQQSLAETLGAGLSDVASHWANVKSSESALRGLGLNEAQAKSLARLQSPHLQQQLIQHQLQQQQQQASNAAINQILGEGLPQSNFQQSPIKALPRQQQMAPMQQVPQQAPIEQASSILQNPAFQKLQKQAQDAQQLQQAQLAPRGPVAAPTAAGSLPGESQAIIANQIAQQKPSSYQEKIDQINRQRRALAATGLSPNDRFKAEALLNSAEDRALKEEQHREKIASAKGERIEKRENTLRKELEDISKRAERAQTDIHLLNQIKKANDTGTLVQGPKRKILEDLSKKYGLDFTTYFTNPTTENTAKLIERMQTGAGTAFGTGRLTNFIADAYSKSLPRLANTQEGMDVIIKNLILEDQSHIALNDEIRKIKGEYRKSENPLPFDIQDMARERVQPTLDQYAQEALSNIDTAVSRQEGFASGKIRKFDSMPNAGQFTNGSIGTNKKTGKKFVVENGKWVPYV